MLALRSTAVDRLAELTGATREELRGYRRELVESELADRLLERGAGAPFVSEMPQGALLYLAVRALRPDRIVETGVRPGYSTAWMLAGLKANGRGELTSLGPGSGAGRAAGVERVGVGQFVAPALRGPWTLELGNSTENFERVLASGGPIQLAFLDNGADPDRTRSELRGAWRALSRDGMLLVQRAQANPAWAEFCRFQGRQGPQLLDPGPPALGVLSVRAA